MRLSVIVPVYNMAGGGKLNKCLESLLNQELTDYEIIAVDDCSTDESPQILREFGERYAGRLKVLFSPENRRQGGARNLGLAHACGEWVGFVDSDDWVAQNMFSKLLQRAEETGADIVGCDYLITDRIGREEGTPVINNTAEQTGVLTTAQRKRLLLDPGSMVIKIYRRSIFTENAIRFPEKMFYEDNAIAALPFLYAERFERVEECLYFYYQHEQSTVHVVSVEKCRDRMRAMEILREECRARGCLETYAGEIAYKAYELGYRNTLFSYLQTVRRVDMGFLRELKTYLKENAPDIEQNPYYREEDAETRKLVGLHLKSPVLFLGYYRLLNLYRRFRGGKRDRA